jgi:hypothetical protein
MDSSARRPYPRALTDREREVLDFMLSFNDPRVEPLRGQARTAQVVGHCDCGCATIDLQVDRAATKPSRLGSPALDATNGQLPPCELILFLDEGWLSSLEIVYYDGQPPAEFPPAASFGRPWIPAESDREEPKT